MRGQGARTLGGADTANDLHGLAAHRLVVLGEVGEAYEKSDALLVDDFVAAGA